jgi:hypothetical protein
MIDIEIFDAETAKIDAYVHNCGTEDEWYTLKFRTDAGTLTLFFKKDFTASMLCESIMESVSKAYKTAEVREKLP